MWEEREREGEREEDAHFSIWIVNISLNIDSRGRRKTNLLPVWRPRRGRPTLGPKRWPPAASAWRATHPCEEERRRPSEAEKVSVSREREKGGKTGEGGWDWKPIPRACESPLWKTLRHSLNVWSWHVAAVSFLWILYKTLQSFAQFGGAVQLILCFLGRQEVYPLNVGNTGERRIWLPGIIINKHLLAQEKF